MTEIRKVMIQLLTCETFGCVHKNNILKTADDYF